MRSHAAEGMMLMMMMITHEMGFAKQVGDRLVFLDDGIMRGT